VGQFWLVKMGGSGLQELGMGSMEGGIRSLNVVLC
jgi:hypothetical protein